MSFFRTLSLFSLISQTIVNVPAQSVGPIATDKPSPAGGDVATDSPLTSFFAGLSPPYPTNSWWAGYAASPGNAVCAGPFPYETSLASSAIQFGVSTSRDFDGTSIHQPTQTDWLAGFVEHSGAASDHKATGWDTQSVTVQYFTGSSTMTSYLVPGSPYLTFEYSSATPMFTSGQGSITSFNNETLATEASSTQTASKFSVTNNIGTYLIYSLSGDLTLTVASNATSGTVTASAPFTGILRLVKLNDSSHEALLDQYYENYPVGVNTDYTFDTDANTAVLSFTWNVTGDEDSLLMLTWPHHRMKMVSPNFPATTALNYLTTKGYMYPAIGNVWNMQYDLPTIDWNAPRAPDSSCSSTIIQGLEYEIGQLNVSEPSVPGDFYYWGGSMAAQSRLALIADAMGRSDLIPQVIDYMEASFAYWFDPSSTILPAYETNWGGIVNNEGATNVNVDFGNGYYNDHHFHYGYFLASAAVVAKYDSAWLSAHETAINWFLRDIANPSTADPYFPIARCRDFFAGHSWASGIANGAGSRDQESTGEAINGYYGAMLWAEVAGNTDMKNYAALLLATEQHAAQTYWHMYPQTSGTDRDQPYPEDAIRDLITIGNVEDWQSGAWLFWGDQKVEIAAIQILPVTPVNEYLYDTQWVQNIWSYASDEINNATFADEWKCVIYCAYSNFDPVTAMSMSTELTDWGTGNTFTNQVYFIATRPNTSGQALCTDGSANPLGNFTIQSVDTNDYVVASAANTNLVANSSSSSDAAVFNFAFTPNAGTIQLQSSSQYVTADSSGNFTLAAIRATASTWETFLIRQKTGAATGVYTIKATSNGLWITLGSDGSLINNGETESAGAGFLFNAA